MGAEWGDTVLRRSHEGYSPVHLPKLRASVHAAAPRGMQAYRSGSNGGDDGMTRRDDPGRLLEQSAGGIAGEPTFGVNQTYT